MTIKRFLVIAGMSVVISFTVAYCTVSSHAENWEQSGPPECYSVEQCAKIDSWYSNVKQNASEVSCCGKSDAYWADKARVDNGQYFVEITDNRKIQGRKDRNGEIILVPSEKIDNKRQGNPSGHVVIFISPTDVVYCFFPQNFF